MEREIRRFKRTIKKETFKYDLKKKMNIHNFTKKRPDHLETEILKEISRRSKLSKTIKNLPKELQKKIYIFSMRAYWKQKTIDTPLKPMWYEWKEYMNNNIRSSLFDNVHFLHLECNTLEKNKEWIPGCQCSYCLNDTKVKNKEDIYRMIATGEDNGEELEKRTHCYSPIPNFWNCYLKYYGYNFDITTMKIFDPIKGYYQNQMNLITEDPHESPIYFSSEVEDY